MMGCIYKIINLNNNKVYIGQTVKSIAQRWQEHIFHAENNTHNDCGYLSNAIKKYGRKSFKYELIEQVQNDKLNERECYWIKFYDSTNREKGYNLAIGGSGYQKYTDEEIKNAYFSNNCNLALASQNTNISQNTLAYRLNQMGISTAKHGIVQQFDLLGNLLQTYDNFAEAQRQTKLNLPHIIPKTHFSCGYFWAYREDNFDINLINKTNIPELQEIEQYSPLGEFIQSFKNAQQASNELNINVSSIKANLLGKQKSAGGYIWHRKYGNLTFQQQYEDFLLSPYSCTEIEEIDINGLTIKTFTSAGAAEKELGWSYGCIQKVCNYKAKSTHGRYFQYSNPNKRDLLKQKVG